MMVERERVEDGSDTRSDVTHLQVVGSTAATRTLTVYETVRVILTLWEPAELPAPA